MISSASEPKSVVTGYPAATAGSSYPYPAPPPASYYPNGHPPPPPPQPLYYPAAYPAAAPPPRYNTAFLRRLLSIAFAFFLIFGLVTLIIWLVLRPRLPQVTVSSATLSGFNLSTSQQLLSGDFDLNLTVHNPNSKMGIYYDHVAASVHYGSERLSDTSLAPFYQAKGATTGLRSRLVAVGVYVDSYVVNGINSDLGRGDGAVRFQVRVSAWVRFKPGAWRTRWHIMRVYCDDVPIGLRNGTTAAATGYLVGSTPKKCVVNL
ncbi:hypothetical protein BHM03_00015060 [Ensete ventricosum]|nr:hypothetical protein BHM03_00015060 [Ensete ventricosum]